MGGLLKVSIDISPGKYSSSNSHSSVALHSDTTQNEPQSPTKLESGSYVWSINKLELTSTKAVGNGRQRWTYISSATAGPLFFSNPITPQVPLTESWYTNSNVASMSRTVRHSTQGLRGETTYSSFRSQVRVAWGTTDWRGMLEDVDSPGLPVPLTPEDRIIVREDIIVSSPLPDN